MNRKNYRKIKGDTQLKDELTVDVNNVKAEDKLITDIAFVTTGNVDAGKSSFIGALITGILDDGNGSARKYVAVHEHELEKGRGKTSDISSKIIKLADGRVATLIDLCGHEKYFSTTAYGITAMMPDYGFSIISPSRGVLQMTKQHFMMLTNSNIPTAIIVTKIDVALKNSCEDLEKSIKNILCKGRKVLFINSYDDYWKYRNGKDACTKYNIHNKNELNKLNKLNKLNILSKNNDVDKLIDCIEYYLDFDIIKHGYIDKMVKSLQVRAGTRQNYVPVLYISNVDGYCLDVAKHTIMYSKPRDLWAKCTNDNFIIKCFSKVAKLPNLNKDFHKGATFYIDNTFYVKGAGIVLSGINRGDDIFNDDVLHMGPINKKFIRVKIRNIRNDNDTDVHKLSHHHRGCLNIKACDEIITRKIIKKGVVLLSDVSMTKYVCFRFDALVTISDDMTATLRTGYSPIVHAGTIKQACKMILPSDKLTQDEINKLMVSNDDCMTYSKAELRNLVRLRKISKIELNIIDKNGKLSHEDIQRVIERKNAEKEQYKKLSNRERRSQICHKLEKGRVTRVTFKFKYHPEYIEPHTIFFFKSGEIHGTGVVLSVLELSNDSDPNPEPVKKKHIRDKSYIK